MSTTEILLSKLSAINFAKLNGNLIQARRIGMIDEQYEEFMEQYEQEFQEHLMMDIIEEELNIERDSPTCHRPRRTIYARANSFWETDWGNLIRHPDVCNIRTRMGKRFRRRFRLPFPLFEHVVNICKTQNIFQMKYESRIPVEAKILACLRILGRDHCCDDINVDSNGLIGESTANYLFKQFVEGMATHVYSNF